MSTKLRWIGVALPSFGVLVFIFLLLGEAPAQQPTRAGSVLVYLRTQGLRVEDAGDGPARNIPVRIQGSSGLKLAFLARASGGITEVPLNLYDRRAHDNTTPKAYAWVDEHWRPVLYRADRFRYNATMNRTVAAQTDYAGLRFFGQPTPSHRGVLELRNLVIYRGDDTDAPEPPAALDAAATESGVALSWVPAHDNVAAALYVVARAHADGPFVKIGETREAHYLDRPPAPGRYRYRVLAADYQDNLSRWSPSTAVTASRAFAAPPEPTRYEMDRRRYAEHIREIHARGRGKVRKGRVLLFGDSLTAALNYWRFTQAALARYEVEARGRPGARTPRGRAVIGKDLAEHNPEFCLILYGTNNDKTDPVIARSMDDMLAMADACAANGTVPVVATIPPRGFDDPQSRPEARYNAALIDTMRAHAIPVAYLFREFQARPERRRLLAADGVHWGGEGFALAARVWEQAMDQVSFALLDRPDAGAGVTRAQ